MVDRDGLPLRGGADLVGDHADDHHGHGVAF